MCQVEEHEIFSIVGKNSLNQSENLETSNIFISFLIHTYMRIIQINSTINCSLYPLVIIFGPPLVSIRSIVKQLFGSLALPDNSWPLVFDQHWVAKRKRLFHPPHIDFHPSSIDIFAAAFGPHQWYYQTIFSNQWNPTPPSSVMFSCPLSHRTLT